MKKFIILLVIIGFVVYFNSLFNGFVWDDEEQIVKNTVVHSAANIPQFFQGSTFNSGGSGSLVGTYYRPMMTIVFSVIYQIVGPQPFFYHLLQVTIHIINSVLIFYLFCRFGFVERLSFFLAAVFLVHPANVESVTYISAIQDVLYVFFGLLALSNKKILLTTLFIFLGLLTKETAIAFILIILFYLYLYKKPITNYFVFFSLSVGSYLILRLGVADIFFTKFHFAPIVQATLQTRLFMIPGILFHYFKIFFFPKNLAVMQHWIISQININNFFIPLIGEVVLLFLIIYLLWENKYFWFFLFWFLILIFPYLQIFALDMTVAERWFYAPMIGLLGIIGLVISKIPDRVNKDQRSKIIIVVGLLIIGFLSLRTIKRNLDWKNGLTLFSRDVKISKNSFDLENNLGVELFRVGKYDAAKKHFENSCKLSPSWWVNWNNLGAVYEKKNDLDRAEKFYLKSLNNGDYYLAYENYTGILIQQKKYQQAKQFLEERALRKFPYNEKLSNAYNFLLTNPN